MCKWWRELLDSAMQEAIESTCGPAHMFNQMSRPCPGMLFCRAISLILHEANVDSQNVDLLWHFVQSERGRETLMDGLANMSMAPAHQSRSQMSHHSTKSCTKISGKTASGPPRKGNGRGPHTGRPRFQVSRPPDRTGIECRSRDSCSLPLSIVGVAGSGGPCGQGITL